MKSAGQFTEPLAGHRVSQMDAIVFMSSLADSSVDLVLTDIPYERVNKRSGGLRQIDKGRANHSTFDLLEFMGQVFRITKGSAVIFCGKEQFSDLYRYCDAAGVTTRMVVWEKTNPMPMNGQYVFLSGVETAVHFKKRGGAFNAHCVNTVFRFPNGSSKRHPTEKPLLLFKRFVEILTNPGDVVVDPCVGSGTTAVACAELGRLSLTNDICSEFVKVAVARLKGI